MAWHGGVSPCPPLLHTYTCFVSGREKHDDPLAGGPAAGADAGGDLGEPGLRRLPRARAALRLPSLHRLRGCDLAETNEEDCFGNPHPVCGDCLWARGIIRCA